MCPTPVDGLRGGGRDHINLKKEFGLFTHHAQNWAPNMPLMLITITSYVFVDVLIDLFAFPLVHLS